MDESCKSMILMIGEIDKEPSKLLLRRTWSCVCETWRKVGWKGEGGFGWLFRCGFGDHCILRSRKTYKPATPYLIRCCLMTQIGCSRVVSFDIYWKAVWLPIWCYFLFLGFIVPLKLQSENCRPDSLSIRINWYHFWPPIRVIRQYFLELGIQGRASPIL